LFSQLAAANLRKVNKNSLHSRRSPAVFQLFTPAFAVLAKNKFQLSLANETGQTFSGPMHIPLAKDVQTLTLLLAK
jgi:hypothetical protein